MQRTLTGLIAVAVSLFLVACGGEAGTGEQNEGQVRTTIWAQTAAGDVDRVRVFTTPAAVDQNLTPDPVTGAFSGIFTVPTGTYRVTVEAYAGSELVGTGTSDDVPVAKGAVAQVELTIRDTTGPVDVPDHSPWIASFVVAQSSAEVGDAISVSSTARDIDGDTLAFAWAAIPAGCGDFAVPSAASTTFTARTLGTCTLRLTVSAGGKTDSRTASVTVSPATGRLEINGTFVPHPRVTLVEIVDGATVLASVDRVTSTDATVRLPLVASKTYGVRVRFDAVDSGTVQLSNDCGATLVQPAFTAPGSVATGSWTAPAVPGACVITARLTRDGLVDQFPVALVATP
jgi:hypothetical protein